MARLDLTAAETTRFEVSFPGKDGAPPITIDLDFDEIAIDLQQFLPTLFEPISGGGSEDAKKTGLQVVLESWREGKKLPESLPGLKQIIASLRTVFQIPSHCGVLVVLGVFEGWLSEVNRRMEVKKNTEPSQS